MGNPQPKVLEQEYGWFAGFFDGEGSVILSIRLKGGKGEGPKIQPNAKIAGTDVEGLNACTDILTKAEIPHHVTWYQPRGQMRNGNAYKMAWDITIAGHKRCRRFYEWITPALRVKQERAQVILDYMNLRTRHSDFRTPITQDEWEMAMQLRTLNLKGKAQPYLHAVKLNTERPGASSEQLAENARRGAAKRWGIRD